MRRWGHVFWGVMFVLCPSILAGCGGKDVPKTEGEWTRSVTAGTVEAGAGSRKGIDASSVGQPEISAPSGEAPLPGQEPDSGECPVSGQTAGLSELSVEGTGLVDAFGNPVQLRGVSTHGLAWYPGYVNQECFRQLKQEWGMNVVRLAMYTAESGGYCTGGSQNDLKELVKSGVEYATEADMYVIIDWHILSDGDPGTYLEEAKDFFGEMSEEYAEHTNVIYEICNEPNGGTSWSDIKSYAEKVIEVIRSNDEDGIILVGTPNWSQYVDQAAADPIEGYDNIMYTLHFYAATHTDSLRSAMIGAIEDGLPIFVSEYGICDASGNGAIDREQADKWIKVLDEYRISYVAWNLSNKSETSAVFKSSCNKVSGFGEDDLSASGRWLYGMLQAATAGELGSEGMGDFGIGNAGAGNTGIGNTGTGDAGAGNTGIGDPDAGGTDVSGESSRPGGDGGLRISADVVNSWKQDGESYFQYAVTISNNTGAEQSGWTLRLVFGGDIALSDKWNGNYQVEGNTLTISALDYNSRIAKDGSVGDIGFILHGADDLAISDMAVVPADR